MLIHKDILKSLQTAFPDEVHIVARYATPHLELPGGRAHLFLPDFHLLNDEDALAYPNNGFVQDEDLLQLLKRLARLKKNNPAMLLVWHLGDLFDIWRARGGLGPAAEVDKIRADHGTIIDRLRLGPPTGVRALFMAGNHDFELFNLTEWQAARWRIIENEDRDAGDVLVLHGDIFSWIERLPDEIAARAVRFARWTSSGEHDLFNDQETVASLNRELPLGDRPLGENKASLTSQPLDAADLDINVINGETGHPNAKNKKFYKGAKALATAMRERGHNIRVVVIGHTHFARIVKGEIEGKPFVLMDCGSWIGSCRLAPEQPFQRCAQVGVLAQNELRLYQLGRREDD